MAITPFLHQLRRTVRLFGAAFRDLLSEIVNALSLLKLPHTFRQRFIGHMNIPIMSF